MVEIKFLAQVDKEKCIGCESTHSIHGLFAERDVVSEVETDADPFASESLQPRNLLGGTPTFVIFYPETHFVFAQDWFCQGTDFWQRVEGDQTEGRDS
jgi:hypothetical protein